MAILTFYVNKISENQYSVLRYYQGGYYQFQTTVDPSGATNATCNCPTFINSGMPCRHIAVVNAYVQSPQKTGYQWAQSDVT